jgi:hypothetical protein
MHGWFLFAFLFLSQAVDVVPIIGKPDLPATRRDGIGEEARFGGISAIWNVGPNLYIADGPTIRILNLQTREVSTLTLRAGTGRRLSAATSGQGLNAYTGLADLWSDGAYLYATDIGSGTIRRILLSTGEVERFSSAGPVSWGLTGTTDTLFVANANTREILRVDRPTRTSQRFMQLSLPIDPSECFLGSGCVGYYVPSPRDLWSDGKYIYATGLNTSIRRIEIVTRAETNLPPLPFIPRTITGDQTFVYVNSGQEIGRQNLLTGEYQTIARVPGANYVSIVGYEGAIYAATNRSIFRIDIGTGEITRVAGMGLPSGINALWREGDSFYGYGDHSILKINAVSGGVTTFAGRYRDRWIFTDGVGTDAEFANLQGMWGDGSFLYVGDAHGVRRVNLSTAEVTTLTGGAVGNPQEGSASTARLGYETGLWGVGDYLYVTDPALWLIYKIDKRNGDVTRFAGSPVKITGYQPGEGPGYVDGPGPVARFRSPEGIWSDGSLLYVTDENRIRTISVATAEVRTLAKLPDSFSRIWGDDDNLYVTGHGGTWRVSRSTGAFEPIIDGGTGPTRGFILRPNADALIGYGGSLFIGGNGAISRVESRPLPADTNFRLNAAESTEWKTISDAGSITLGYGFIDPAAAGASGMAIYASRQNGAIVSETSVPLYSLITEGRIYASVQGPINTGIAIANPSELPATITFYFTDIDGNDFGKGSFTIPPHQQIAKFLNEAPFSDTLPSAGILFGSKPIKGTFTFKSSVGVGAVALRGLTNERSEFLMTTLPIAPLSSGGTSSTILPHYAAGDGWSTEVILVNPTDAAISGTLDFQTVIPYTIPPRTSSLFTSADSSSTTTGSVTVTASIGGSPVASAIFSFRKNGVTVTSAGVPEVDTSKAFEVFGETDGNFARAQAGTMGTGIAISNPDPTPLTINVEEFSLDGLPTGHFGLLTIPARGHVAIFTHEIPHASLDPSTWITGVRGRIRLWTDSGSGFSVIGLRARYNERGEFLITSTPALPDDAPINTGPLVFPHFVQGGGYTTEFVLLNRTVGVISSGTVRYFSPSGEPSSVPLERVPQ